jgi:hypothetical protein
VTGVRIERGALRRGGLLSVLLGALLIAFSLEQIHEGALRVGEREP